MIKLVVLDVDGVMTSGKKYYNQEGIAQEKEFNDKDFTAIKRIKAAGIPVIFLSGDKNINEAVAQNRNIPFYHSLLNGQIEKLSFVSILSQKYQTRPENIAYVGDDLFDLEIIEKVGHKYCPNDAIEDLKKVCIILNRAGGEGVIESLYQSMVIDNLITPASIVEIKHLDALEKY